MGLGVGKLFAWRAIEACWRRHGHMLDLLPLHLKIKFCFDRCGANGQAAVDTYRKSGCV
jgi:hypothetical protein